MKAPCSNGKQVIDEPINQAGIFINFSSSIGFRGPSGEIVCEISVTPASSAFQSGTYRHALPLAYFRTARRAPAHLGVPVRDGGC